MSPRSLQEVPKRTQDRPQRRQDKHKIQRSRLQSVCNQNDFKRTSCLGSTRRYHFKTIKNCQNKMFVASTVIIFAKHSFAQHSASIIVNDTCAWTPNSFFLKSFWLQTLCNLRLWILCLFWCLLGRSCAHFGTSWGDLGVILEPLGGVLAASCGSSQASAFAQAFW